MAQTVADVCIPRPPLLSQRVQDSIGGTVAGMACKLFEHPFDTLKVRLQTSTKYTGPVDCLRQTVRQEGAVALFRGITAPLFGSAAENCIQFIVYEEMRRRLRSEAGAPLGIFQTGICGATAGAVMSFWLTPVELVKCRQQSPPADRLYRGSLDCIRQTFKEEGLRGFYKGHIATMPREIIGVGVFFAGYETVSRALSPADGEKKAWTTIAAGSCAGIAYWTSVFPMDTVKSRLQVLTTGQPPAARNTSSVSPLRSSITAARFVFLDIMKEGGVRGLYAGLGVTLVRAVPSNSCLFLVYEAVNSLLRQVCER
eukprot:TRINITY_DN9060_c0_g1_i1.p1 TRINITY_DN9060_c0_g1~~TRINITY_DN9060_c0_g1_i1.p1  ORF type:complete len:312 (-),score=64.72 TRINITY_DN9060_c0_g1_i1:97-1032(-)